VNCARGGDGCVAELPDKPEDWCGECVVTEIHRFRRELAASWTREAHVRDFVAELREANRARAGIAVEERSYWVDLVVVLSDALRAILDGSADPVGLAANALKTADTMRVQWYENG
jgi:hypothetical protein